MRSTYHTEMYLRNGKIKTEPIDLDDDYVPEEIRPHDLVSQNNMRNRVKQLIKNEIESDDDDDDDTNEDGVNRIYQQRPAVDRVLRVRRSQSTLPHQSNVRPKWMRHQVKATKATDDKYVNQNSEKPDDHSNHIVSVQLLDTSTPGYDERRTYCCFLCGKTFQHLCRLKTHMPAHTREQRFQCTLCCKRYKSSSSLNVHKNILHFGKPRKSRSIVKKVGRKHCAYKTPAPINDCEIVEMKIDPNDANEMEMEVLEMDPLEICEPCPFIWHDCDSQLTEPMTVDLLLDDQQMKLDQYDQKAESVENVIKTEMAIDDVPQTTIDSTNHIEGNILKVIAHENQPHPVRMPKVSPRKFEIWQKETTVDPLAWYADILRVPKSMRTLFPAVSADASRHAANGTSDTMTGHMKNTALASGFRGFGDIEFSLKKWDSARQWYNRSLCHADQKTFHFSTAYAKRAQCYFNERMYRTCWTDLMLAEQSGLPDVLLPQLERHKRSCKLMILQQCMQMNQSVAAAAAAAMPAPVQLLLSFPAHPKFPEMANALQIDWNDFYGRYIRACAPISVGEILIIETGFVATTSAYYEKCCICLTADTNLVPCSKCTKALLCKNCVNGWFHQIECELEMRLNFHEYPWLAKVVRSFLNAINLFETVDEMMQFVDDAISNGHRIQSIFDQKSKYRAFLQLINVRTTIESEIIPVVSELQTVLLLHPAIGTKFGTSIKTQRFLAHLLVHHIYVINAFTTKVCSAVCANGYNEIVAPITSYLKHSCAPNASKFLLGNAIIVVAMRPIECGEQLFVSYCDLLKAKNDRQTVLQTQYGFQCNCERCEQLSTSVDGIDQQMLTFQCAPAEQFIQQNFHWLASNDQTKRKQLTETVVSILQQFGRMPWNYTIGWAYVVFSLLLSHRFQKKLSY